MKKLVWLLLAGALLLLVGCDSVESSSAVGMYFDTVVTLTGNCDKTILDDALKECAKYEKLLSKTIEGSDVWNINHANGASVEVSDDTKQVLETALYVSKISDGAFDITIAPAVALWDFTGESGLPDEKALEEAASLTDYTKITLEGNDVTLPENMQIDLGGVAKGYIADRIAQYLKSRGVTSAIVNLGGNVVTVGHKTDGSQWKIGIQDPKGETADTLMTVESEDSSVVTSGTYQRCFTLEGVCYHHILDTKTGRPVDNDLASVTVLSKDSALGDALATACMALGEEKALEMIQGIDETEIICVHKDGKIVRSQQ